MSIVDDRVSTHGDPVANMERIARRWTRVLGMPVTAVQVALCMAELHVIRARHAPKWDPAHREHANGYYEIAKMIKESNDSNTTNGK